MSVIPISEVQYIPHREFDRRKTPLSVLKHPKVQVCAAVALAGLTLYGSYLIYQVLNNRSDSFRGNKEESRQESFFETFESTYESVAEAFDRSIKKFGAFFNQPADDRKPESKPKIPEFKTTNDFRNQQVPEYRFSKPPSPPALLKDSSYPILMIGLVAAGIFATAYCSNRVAPPPPDRILPAARDPVPRDEEQIEGYGEERKSEVMPGDERKEGEEDREYSGPALLAFGMPIVNNCCPFSGLRIANIPPAFRFSLADGRICDARSLLRFHLDQEVEPGEHYPRLRDPSGRIVLDDTDLSRLCNQLMIANIPEYKNLWAHASGVLDRHKGQIQREMERQGLPLGRLDEYLGEGVSALEAMIGMTEKEIRINRCCLSLIQHRALANMIADQWD